MVDRKWLLLCLALLWSGPALAADSVPISSCNGVPLDQWLSARGLKGYHALCLEPSSTVVCWHGRSNYCEHLQIDSPTSLLDLEKQLITYRAPSNAKRHNIFNRSLKGNPRELFAFYKVKQNSDKPPSRIASPKDVSGLVLVFEGGYFLWPGIEPGFKRNITLTLPSRSKKTLLVQLVTLSLSPQLFDVHTLKHGKPQHFMRPKEAAKLKKLGLSRIREAGKGGNRVIEHRNSSTIFLPPTNDLLESLDEYSAALAVIDKNMLEDTQISRYRPGDYFSIHTDPLNPAIKQEAGYKEELQQTLEGGLNNRMGNLLFYLTDNQGGHTLFPYAHGLIPKKDDQFVHDHLYVKNKCELGIAVRPEIGKHVLFYNHDAAGFQDGSSHHAGCPVKEGEEKWLINKWTWQRKRILSDEENARANRRAEGDEDDE